MAAPQTVIGPYKVVHLPDGRWEIVERVKGKVVRLRPRLVYAEEKRVSAYRRVALMNRKWQEGKGK